MLLIGVITAYFVTFSTLSICFLSPDQKPGEFCSMIPGFEQSVARNDTLLQRFESLIETTEQNERRIAELEAQLKANR